MRQNWLTVKMVGDLQDCIEDGRDIQSIVSSLDGATLPGLVEYRCLRRIKKDLVPQLPPSVRSSTIGKAFGDLSRSLDFRETRVGSSSLRRIDTQPAEFYIIDKLFDPEDDNWKAFTIRFARSAKAVGLDKIVADGLRGALLESIRPVRVVRNAVKA